MAQINQPNLSLDRTKSALRDVLEAFCSPDNKALMDKQKEAAGNDMMHMMHLVFPAATQIQMEAIQKYGFTPDGEGAIKFAQTVRQYESADNEIAEMASRLKSMFLPPLPSMAPPQSQGPMGAS
ncbi:protein C10-like [Lytechinus variegatus]|uniref:protein C10-like n=1 Tax=Lytechinus variegatus TaxID=7654 RepID=UPI001BB0F282|nr:protein C10-like [Lytechinus variegatus]